MNSKATLQIPLEDLLKHVPSALHAEIRRSRYIAQRSNNITIQADDSRKQTDNAHSCYARLYQMIIEAGRDAVPGETSAAQSKRVKNLCVLLILGLMYSDQCKDGKPRMNID